MSADELGRWRAFYSYRHRKEVEAMEKARRQSGR